MIARDELREAAQINLGAGWTARPLGGSETWSSISSPRGHEAGEMRTKFARQMAADIAALTAGQSGAGDGAPAGYKLVPIKPTPEMLAAADSRLPRFEEDDETGYRLMGVDGAHECWSVMLDAAPPASAADLGAPPDFSNLTLRQKVIAEALFLTTAGGADHDLMDMAASIACAQAIAVDRVLPALNEDLREALYRLKTECEIEGLADKPGFDCWLSLANKVLGSTPRRAFGINPPSTPEHEGNVVREGVEPDGSELCDDCPPPGYPTDKTRCRPCPRRAGAALAAERGGAE